MTNKSPPLLLNDRVGVCISSACLHDKTFNNMNLFSLKKVKKFIWASTLIFQMNRKFISFFFFNIVLILKLKNTKNSEREYKYFISTYI